MAHLLQQNMFIFGTHDRGAGQRRVSLQAHGVSDTRANLVSLRWDRSRSRSRILKVK